MLPLAFTRVAVKGARGEGSVNKLNCTSLQPGSCGAWRRVGERNKWELLENMRSALIDTLVPESTNSPFVIVLGVTLQAGIVALL